VENSSIDPRATAQEFDDFILEVKRDKAQGQSSVDPDVMLGILRDHDRFSLVQLVDAYRAGGAYPEDRLIGVVHRFADLKLATEYVHVLTGVINEVCVLPTIIAPARAGTPRLRLINMALDQALIGTIRIGWEKLMRAVYYLETGVDIPKKRSVKAFFFRWADERDNWRFLQPYATVVESHDDHYRTPEFHKHSILRRQAFGGSAPDPNDMMTAYNYLSGAIWPNVLDVLVGKQPSIFTNLHLSTSTDGLTEIDPRFVKPRPQAVHPGEH